MIVYRRWTYALRDLENSVNACWIYFVESVSKMVLSVIFFILFAIYGIVSVIRSIHLSHCCHICLWLCVRGCCTSKYSRWFHIYPRKAVFLLPLLLCSPWCVQIIGNVIAWGSYSFVCSIHLQYHHFTDVCEAIEYNSIEYTRCLSGILCRLCVNSLNIHLCIVWTVCFQVSHFPSDDCANMCT